MKKLRGIKFFYFMKLDEKTINKFRKLYKKRFNEDIDKATAEKLVRKVCILFKVVYGSSVNKENDRYE